MNGMSPRSKSQILDFGRSYHDAFGPLEGASSKVPDGITQSLRVFSGPRKQIRFSSAAGGESRHDPVLAFALT